MIESARIGSVLFCTGRASMPTSRMFFAPVTDTWPFCWAWTPAEPSRSSCDTLRVAYAKIAVFATMPPPLRIISSAPKNTNIRAQRGPRVRPVPT